MSAEDMMMSNNNSTNRSIPVCLMLEIFSNPYFASLALVLPYILAVILNISLFFVVISSRTHRRQAVCGGGVGLALDLIVCNYAITAIMRTLFHFCIIMIVLHNKSRLFEHFVWSTLWAISDGFFDACHVTFCVLLSLHSLFYFLKPLHYHKLITTRRAVCLCVASWLLVALEPILSETIEGPSWLITIVAFELIPVVFSLATAIVVTCTIYKSRKFAADSRRFSNQRRKPIWETALRTFQAPAIAAVFFCPFIAANVVYSFFKEDTAEVYCEPANAIIFTVTQVLSNFYLCGIPVAILAMHGMYWAEVKRMISEMRLKRQNSVEESSAGNQSDGRTRF